MAIRIEVKSSYFLITDTVSGVYFDPPANCVDMNKITEDGTEFEFADKRTDERFFNRVIYFSEIVDKDDNPFASVEELTDFVYANTSSITVSSNTTTLVDVAKNELGYDVWGRLKTVQDNSIFHGMFSFNVPTSAWYERINDVEQTAFTNATSVNGALELVSGATLNDKSNLRTRRNPRYEPNRGYLYSTALMLENPSDLGNRRFGAATNENGVYFSLESGTLYGIVRTTRTGVTTEDKYLIDTTGIDLSKGNVYDARFQWRGVGNYTFYINLQEVVNTQYLGTLTELSMANPALPAFYECENLGNNVKIKAGCIDISSEGGKENGKTYGSVSVNNDNGQVSISGLNQPVIAIRSKLTVGGLINTRDVLSLLASAYGDQRCLFRIWSTRDFTAITENDQSWTDFGDGHLEYIVNDVPDVGSPMTFDTSKAELIFGCRVNQDDTYSTSALFEGRTSIYQTPGDMFVFTMHRENGGNTLVGVTYEFAEEI